MHLLNALPQRLDPGATPTFAGLIAPSLTAPASTSLTLAGGSSGASLVLGHTTQQSSLTGGGAAVGSSANLVVGSTAGVSTNSVGVAQISASSDTYASITSIAHNAATGNTGYIFVGKSRGTKAAPTIVADADILGEYGFIAYDGSAYRTSAAIRALISGTPGATDLPTRLAFFTASDGSSSPTERATITPLGNLLIGGTTDITGSGGLKVFGTTAASSTTTGALIVAGGVGVAGAGYFGGLVSSNARFYASGGGGGFWAGASDLTLGFYDAAGSMVFRTSGINQLTLAATTGAATFAGAVIAPAATASLAPLRIPHGTAPTSPTDGDMWTTTAGLFIRINGATVGPLS